MSGKDVRLLQLLQATLKLVPADVLIRGKDVISDQSLQKLLKSVTAP